MLPTSSRTRTLVVFTLSAWLSMPSTTANAHPEEIIREVVALSRLVTQESQILGRFKRKLLAADPSARDLTDRKSVQDWLMEQHKRVRDGQGVIRTDELRKLGDEFGEIAREADVRASKLVKLYADCLLESGAPAAEIPHKLSTLVDVPRPAGSVAFLDADGKPTILKAGDLAKRAEASVERWLKNRLPIPSPEPVEPVRPNPDRPAPRPAPHQPTNHVGGFLSRSELMQVTYTVPPEQATEAHIESVIRETRHLVSVWMQRADKNAQFHLERASKIDTGAGIQIVMPFRFMDGVPLHLPGYLTQNGLTVAQYGGPAPVRRMGHGGRGNCGGFPGLRTGSPE